MKKMVMAFALVLMGGIANGESKKYNNAGPVTNFDIPADTQMITVKNNTKEDLYVGIYTVKKNENPELFGNVFSLPVASKFDAVRRPKNPKGADVRLYFSTNVSHLMPELFPDSYLAKNAVCGSKGKTFCLDAGKGFISANDTIEIKDKYLEIKSKK